MADYPNPPLLGMGDMLDPNKETFDGVWSWAGEDGAVSFAEALHQIAMALGYPPSFRKIRAFAQQRGLQLPDLPQGIRTYLDTDHWPTGFGIVCGLESGGLPLILIRETRGRFTMKLWTVPTLGDETKTWFTTERRDYRS